MALWGWFNSCANEAANSPIVVTRAMCQLSPLPLNFQFRPLALGYVHDRSEDE
jgi:hypothetical protein